MNQSVPMNRVLLFQILFLAGILSAAAAPVKTDLCIYGGTSAGVIAAVQAAGLGKKVVLVEAGQHLGGMSVEGLGGTDIDNHREFQNSPAVGGLTLETRANTQRQPVPDMCSRNYRARFLPRRFARRQRELAAPAKA